MSVGGTSAANQKLWWLIFPLVGHNIHPLQSSSKTGLPRDWVTERQNIPTLSNVGAYTQYSDMHQIRLMLSKFSKGLPWESNSNDFCQALQSKQHAYLNHA